MTSRRLDEVGLEARDPTLVVPGSDTQHGVRAREIFVLHLPGNAQRAQDLALGGLPTGASLLHGVDGASRNTGGLGQLALRESEGLSCSADPIHLSPIFNKTTV